MVHSPIREIMTDHMTDARGRRGLAFARSLVGLLTALGSMSTVCSAQPVTAGSFEVSGVTGVFVNRQTILVQDGTGRSGDVDLTAVNAGVEGTYYLTPHLGIGGLISYQRFSAEAPAQNALFEISGGYFGPLVQLRLPLGGRSEFVFIGSDGGVTASLTNRNTGVTLPNQDPSVTNNLATHVNGRYWLAGGGLSFFVFPKASFDLGVRYQSSTFTGQGTQQATAAGLIVGIAFSIYIS
jgi:hypothetical protein